MENKECEFCGSTKSEVYIKTDLVSYNKCLNCGLIYQYPVLSQEEINDIYSDNYFEYEVANQENFFGLMKLAMKDIGFDKIESELPNKNVLDIGCATGMMLNYLKTKGYNAQGIEICSSSAEYARKNYGITVHEKPLLDVGFESDYFSFIHFSHVIEHVPNPADTLKEIYRILAKGGYLAITTPNADGMFAKKYGGAWRAVMPQHLWLFSKTTLSKYMKSIGFNIISDFSWGSIPIEKKPKKFIKTFFDKYVKLFNRGDVMLFLCKKV
ncbi:class I SAM-dependent methyltransferase [Brachyspira intermedia]|uniref:class I SAM-dependent methyltransferase n=1 Tax=Brachyspira intermedia TaxID=84377 RepID=UPI002628EE54|nr:class I SAM-dependent methyltransferase [uncultured Brachyspira sp.]